MKHTPGPWTFSAPVEGTPDMTVLTYIGPHKVPMYITRVYGSGQYGGPVNQERLANARLIAAAPEMLEALSFVVESYQRNFESFPIAFQTAINMVEAAISKAQGE